MEKWSYKPAKDLGLGPRARVFSVERETTLFSATMQFLTWTLIRFYFRVYHRMKIIGQFPANLKPPFVVIANHSSHLDAMILAAALPPRVRDRLLLVAAGDVFFRSDSRAFLSALFLNCIPLWRKKAGPQAMRELRGRLLERHTGLILFPEGARTRDGKMLPFKPGLGMLVAGTETTIIPCRIRGALKACHPDKNGPLPYQIILHIGKPLRFDDAANNREGWEEVVGACEAAVRGYKVRKEADLNPPT